MTPDRLGDLYAQHREAWLRVARSAGAGSWAEDVVHDACEAVLSGALPLPGEDDPATMVRLVRTMAYAHRDRNGHRERLVQRWGQLPPFEQLTDLDTRVTVQRAVDSLYKTSPLLIWRYLQGESMRSLAAMAGWPLVTTWRRLHGAWGELRVVLAPLRGQRRHRGKAAQACGEPGCGWGLHG